MAQQGICHCGQEGICQRCSQQLEDNIRRLPGLNSACARVLGGSASVAGRERTSGGPLPSGIPLNTFAAEVRSSIIAFLSSWSELITVERGVRAPSRTVDTMTMFLLHHLDWLTVHPAAADARDEARSLTIRARRAASPVQDRRTDTIGACVHAGCSGTLTGVVGTNAEGFAVQCDRDGQHQWDAATWLELGRPAAGAAASRQETVPERWLGATDISRIWNVPTGTVYRLASERNWRRHRRRGGGTLYHETDVVEWFRSRGQRRRSRS